MVLLLICGYEFVFIDFLSQPHVVSSLSLGLLVTLIPTGVSLIFLYTLEVGGRGLTLVDPRSSLKRDAALSSVHLGLLTVSVKSV